MIETKFTPGPWRTTPCSNGGLIVERGGGDAWHHPQGMVQIFPEADAHLIAAAPDLYTALTWALDQLAAFGVGYLPGDMALARARGEPS